MIAKVSNGILRDIIFIAPEEYMSLKRQAKTLDAREKPKQVLFSKFGATQSKFEPSEEKEHFKTLLLENIRLKTFKWPSLNFNSRYQSGDFGCLKNILRLQKI